MQLQFHQREGGEDWGEGKKKNYGKRWGGLERWEGRGGGGGERGGGGGGGGGGVRKSI